VGEDPCPLQKEMPFSEGKGVGRPAIMAQALK